SQARGPDFLPVSNTQSLEVFILQPFVAKYVNSLPLDGRRSVARSDISDLPNQFRSFLRPLLEQARLVRNAVALRSAPLLPVLSHQPATNRKRDESRYYANQSLHWGSDHSPISRACQPPSHGRNH